MKSLTTHVHTDTDRKTRVTYSISSTGCKPVAELKIVMFTFHDTDRKSK